MSAELVDWELAAATARRFARPGPPLPLSEATEVVAELRELAAVADGHVADYTGLHAAAGLRAPVAVLDRGEWSRAAVAGIRFVLDPFLAQLGERRPTLPGPIGGASRRVAGLQLGTGLAWLSGKVLGQYEVFLPPEVADGRLLLIAPNIVELERSLAVPARDFRLWVCLHEQTHRVQFGGVPWLRGHFEGLVRQFLDATDLDPAAVVERLRRGFAALARPGVAGDGPRSLVDLVQTPAQRAVLAELTALMTLLEGHAEQVMDAVGPQVVPSVATIRERFDDRRGGGSPLDRLIRRVLGLDAKLEQYRTGGRFVRAVVDQVGVAGFSEVWTAPERLPSQQELGEPRRWLDRVQGLPALPS
ncbi:MAG: zinc-dependent metalloprotease [Mycobacteriales bacterium]